MAYQQANWITMHGITFEASAAIALRKLDPAARQIVMVNLARLRLRILKTPLNASTPDVVVLEHVQIRDLRVWYVRNETDMLVKRFERTILRYPLDTVHLLHRAEFPIEPLAPGASTTYGASGELEPYDHETPLLAESPPVAFLLTLRNSRLQVALDTRADSALAWQADWTAPHWPHAGNALMLEARLMLDLRLQHDTSIRGAFRIWKREDHGNALPQPLPAPARQTKTYVTRPTARRARPHDLTDRVAAGDYSHLAQVSAMMQAIELLSQGRTDGWALCLDALKAAGDDVYYALSLDVTLRRSTLRRRWQGKVDIEW